MRKLLGDAQLEKACSCASPVQNITSELQSIGRFRGQEIRDFLNSKRTVQSLLKNILKNERCRLFKIIKLCAVPLTN
jgi:hypothetical protein